MRLREEQKKQIEIVLFLDKMMKETLETAINYEDDWQKWRQEVEDTGINTYSPERPTNTEIKRIMLMVRKETIKLDQMI